MDKALIDYLVASFKNESGVNITGDKMAMNRVREARKSQDELSTTMETDINGAVYDRGCQWAEALSNENHLQQNGRAYQAIGG